MIVQKSKKQQRLSAELESIIEDFAQAMRLANKEYIANSTVPYPTTLRMVMTWDRYVGFCKEHKNDNV